MTIGTVRFVVNNAAVFSPRELFIGGTNGFWYDFSDTSTLFQTSTGTTAVTASGDPIGYVVDKSGNNHDAVRSTADANRPTWVPGVDSRPYASFVAASAHSLLPQGLTGLYQNADQGTIIVGLRFTAFALGNIQYVVFFSTPTAGIARVSLYNPSAASTVGFRCRRLDADGGVDLNTPVTPVAGKDEILLGEMQWQGRFGLHLQELSTNQNYTTFPSSTAGATSNTASNGVSIGTDDRTTLPFGGRLYQIIVLNRTLTHGEKQKVLRYVGDKTKGKFN